MMAEDMYQLSKYLKILPRKDDFAVYHSLHGRLCIMDRALVELLYFFKTPRSFEEAYNKNHCTEELLRDFLSIFGSRSFIVAPDENDSSWIKHYNDNRKESLKTGEQISIIQLVVTNHCNFRCSYCFVNSIYSYKKRLELQISKHNKVMSPEIARVSIETVIELLQKNGKQSLHIQFFGGEPIINWGVIEHVLETFGNGLNHGIKISYSIVTNGSLIDEKISEYLKRHNVAVIISFDSPKDRHRILANGTESIHAIEGCLVNLAKYDNRVVFNSVLCEDTFDFFDEDVVNFALRYNVKEIGVLLDLNPSFYENRSTKDIVDKLWKIYKYAKGQGVVITGYWHVIFQQMLMRDFPDDRGYRTCSATGCQLSIEPTGDIFACKGSSGYFGHISDLSGLLTSEVYENYAMRAFHIAPECSECEIKNFCSGFCLGPLEKKYGNIYAIEGNACGVYREITRRLIMDIDKDNVDVFYINNNI